MTGSLVVAADPTQRLRAADLQRQTAHWLAAATTFLDAEEFATAEAWRSVESQTGLGLRRQLHEAVQDLLRLGRTARELAGRAERDPAALATAARAVQLFRRRFTQVETTLEFFGDAVNSRTSETLRIVLRRLDQLAVASMAPVLTAAGIPVPPVLTYVDKGMGASILRAGIRLWNPGTVNPVAAVKVVRHNLYRPTSLFHETGHQVAHLTGWVPSLRTRLVRALADDVHLQRMWLPWASEIAADVYAFLLTGYASVAALYDVVGDDRTIMRWPPGDPHPVGWLRTRLGCAFCRAVFGAGPWDDLERAMMAAHPVDRAEPTTAGLLARSVERLPQLAHACLSAPVPLLAGRPMAAVLDPRRVAPEALGELERTAGPALWRSAYWRGAEGIRMIALGGLREAEDPARSTEWIDRARTWMTTVAAA
ncbi:hypothetical protein [Granulicoccus phenolivorans]|uniref:hypothetical protein n=1 Tax=Granulicoccus phenolivorans TaxID=266854 RepID=UPI000B04C44D|nr:hypothetical protein [Granulicoccus phenolivorans]